jgi:hypothetical protein
LAKSKGLAAILNFIVWGLGYLYTGKRTVLGLGLLIGYIFVHLIIFYIEIQQWLTQPHIYTMVGMTIISLALAYDVYKE